MLLAVCLANVHLVAVGERLGLLQNVRIFAQVFLLLCVMSVDSMRVCHALRRSSEIVFISSSPASVVSSAKGSDS